MDPLLLPRTTANLPTPEEFSLAEKVTVSSHAEADDTQPDCPDPSMSLCQASLMLAGKYQVLEELGQGGMGVVYLVRERDSTNLLVVKMLRSGCFCHERERDQFRQEIDAAFRLKHPGVVQVHSAGEAEGCPYYCMEYINGPSLAQKLGQGPLPCQDAVRLLLPIALAVQHAHEQGILHRDLKPANILLDPHSGPQLIDFGLARRIGESEERDHGAILGTPYYMAPEQAAGRTERMGPAADIYSLGAILYEALTGQTPFGGGNLLTILRQVLEEDPTPPSEINLQVPRDLESICLRCLEKDPQERYPSAQALADDLSRYLNNEPITWVAEVRHPAKTRKLPRDSAFLSQHFWDVLLLALLALLGNLFSTASVGGRLLLGTFMIAVLLALSWRQRVLDPRGATE